MSMQTISNMPRALEARPTKTLKIDYLDCRCLKRCCCITLRVKGWRPHSICIKEVKNKIELEKIWPRFRVRMKAGVERHSCLLSSPKVSEGLRRVWV